MGYWPDPDANDPDAEKWDTSDDPERLRHPAPSRKAATYAGVVGTVVLLIAVVAATMLCCAAVLVIALGGPILPSP